MVHRILTQPRYTVSSIDATVRSGHFPRVALAIFVTSLTFTVPLVASGEPIREGERSEAEAPGRPESSIDRIPLADADGSRAIGVLVDLGLPDGVVGAIALRLHRVVQVHAGIAHNGISPGFRAGFRVPLVGRVVSPYLAAEAGHFLAGDAGGWPRDLLPPAGKSRAEIQTIGYTYANGHLGLQFGSPSAAFYLQGGISWLRLAANLQSSQGQMADPPPDAMAPAPVVEVQSRATLNTYTASGRIGLIVYF